MRRQLFGATLHPCIPVYRFFFKARLGGMWSINISLSLFALIIVILYLFPCIHVMLIGSRCDIYILIILCLISNAMSSDDQNFNIKLNPSSM